MTTTVIVEVICAFALLTMIILSSIRPSGDEEIEDEYEWMDR